VIYSFFDDVAVLLWGGRRTRTAIANGETLPEPVDSTKESARVATPGP
jgi:hypothetical protein